MPNTNTFTNVVPQLLAQGLLALRQMAVMPRFVNRAYETEAGEKGSSIDVPIPSAITAQDVTPSYVPPDDAGSSPTKVNIPLDKWKEAPFFLNDKELQEVMAGTIPMQASEAVKALANQVDNDILALYKGIYGFAGSPGTTPFATDLGEFLDADQVLNDQLAPMDNRYVAINSKAKAAAVGLRAFQDAAWRGDTDGLRKGEIGDKFGAFWFLDQNIPKHTAGTYTTGYTASGANAAGQASVNVTGGALGTLVAGDIITFANDPQTYAVLTSTGGSTVTNITVTPNLATAKSASEAITLKGSHRVNLLFHRDAIALATRPFAGADPLGLGQFTSAVDPVSGLTLRLEVSRQHKRTRFAFDILYGVKLVRAELAARIAGESV